MKQILMIVLSAALTSAAAQNVPGGMTLKNAQDSAGYAYGILIANNVKRQVGSEVNQAILIKSFESAMSGVGAIMSPEEASKYLGEYNRQSQMKVGEKVRKEGEAFLAKNKTRQGVTTTASGLQYEVLQKGAGTVSPAATDRVNVHYHGTLLDGAVFDSSVQRGEPITFGLNEVIKGWTEGVQLMKVGDKFKFFIPYDLAYGERAAGPQIKPYSALIFEVELLGIEGK